MVIILQYNCPCFTCLQFNNIWLRWFQVVENQELVETRQEELRTMRHLQEESERETNEEMEVIRSHMERLQAEHRAEVEECVPTALFIRDESSPLDRGFPRFLLYCNSAAQSVNSKERPQHHQRILNKRCNILSA